MNDLPYLRKRFRKGRRPFYEVICKCGAYHYPHRFGGGYCNGYDLIEFFWSKGMCGNCQFKNCDDWRNENGSECQILNGRGHIAECDQIQEFLRVNEINSERFPRR